MYNLKRQLLNKVENTVTKGEIAHLESKGVRKLCVFGRANQMPNKQTRENTFISETLFKCQYIPINFVDRLVGDRHLEALEVRKYKPRLRSDGPEPCGRRVHTAHSPP